MNNQINLVHQLMLEIKVNLFVQNDPKLEHFDIN